ncbi:glycosyltransferase [Kutzneria kofuensis]|uniref:Glycosyltransferase involved in cell wall biosynthesis n=1 Tax=Kutzneria kofuensis TaxID=103725 RepID=A0A7W9NK47_9PSEU|nr:glycosyltransferase [Kutzneria kofuensis]MBB5895329.1 glycosyltransferase involved in cell wall biosynthesis [Kutzneria kofuensis]
MAGDINVLSLYEGFFSGGARILHSDVLAGLHGQGQRHRVLSIHGQSRREATVQRMQDDASYRKLVAAGMPVSALRAGSTGPAEFDEAELAAFEREVSGVDVVLTLKEQPLRLVNQAGARGKPVITCLHRSDPENQGSALAELRTAVSTGVIAALVCCAESTRAAYHAAGIPADLLEVIPNGVDARRFRPDRLARARLRRALGITPDAAVIVFAARYDVMKNVPLFLAAAAAFLVARPDAHVVMCGAGMTAANPLLTADLAVVGLETSSRLHRLGVRDDPQTLFAAADVVSLTSAFGEAAPLCLIEGMMCGAIPVATDVGDCAPIVAGRGLLTAPEPTAIAAAWAEALTRRDEFGPALRDSRTRFGRRRMIASYARLIRHVSRRTGMTLSGVAA